MAGNHGAIHLNGPQRPQAPQGHVPLPGAGSRPAGPPLAPIHQPPAAPRVGFPADMGRGPAVQISDVSRDLLTIDGMRDQLTEYAIFRFEKMPVQNTYDDDGRLRVPTWERAIRTRVPDMAPTEIARQIRHLNRDTRNLTDKRKSLSPVLQRQVDAAQEQLALENLDPNYHWVLVQLDHQLREIVPYVTAAGGNNSLFRRRHGSNRRRSYPRTSGHTRRAYERISLIAYFKRTPRPNVDIAMLYEARRPRNNHMVPSHPQPPLQLQPQGHQQPHPQPQPQPHPGPNPRAQPPSARPRDGVPPGPNGVRTPAPAVSHAQRPGPGPGPGHGVSPIINIGNDSRGGAKGGGRNHNDIESDSEYSEYSSSDGSVVTQMSPNTSQSSGSLSNGRSRGRDHNDPLRTQATAGRRDENRHVSPKHKQYFDTPNGPRMLHTPGPPPRPPVASPIDIERVRDDAYLAGARDARENARISEQQRAYREARRSRPRPHIIPETRTPILPYRRHSSNSDPEVLRRRGDFDDEIRRFGRLSLDDEDGYDSVLRHGDPRRRREYEYLMQHGSVLDDDPFDRDAPSSYSRHSGKRYQEPYVSDGSDSEYSLSPGGSRRFRY
ncbi:hypothetical protein F5Y13DRAFT_183759 [Hypoxylon sp. FL1857]|nr:hypothetical protein F5Y13DRAFT_183759 [Hypoxylon sp. FL1857]